jgi:ureidoglycolate lyase
VSGPTQHLCPVCGYPDLSMPARSPKSGNASCEICPSCGFQFGYSDEVLEIGHRQWREEWIEAGLPWSGVGTPQPAGWDARRQVRALLSADRSALLDSEWENLPWNPQVQPHPGWRRDLIGKSGRIILAQPLTAEAFAPWGEVLDAEGSPDRLINAGLCGRFHDRARLEFGEGRAGISVFLAEPRSLPYALDLVERHPLGSQAFIPMHREPFLVIVAEGDGPEPGAVHAFLTNGAQGINLKRGAWHGVLTPLAAPGLFAVVDRIGEGANLEEHHYAAPLWVVR